MKNLKLFETAAEQAACEDEYDYLAYCKETDEATIHHDYSQDYLTFVALEDGTFTLTIGSGVPTSLLSDVSYSTDNGDTWVTTSNVDNSEVVITTPTINANNKVLWKGNGVAMSVATADTAAADRAAASSIFTSTGTFNAVGNIMSLLNGDNFENSEFAEGSSSNFALLFYQYNTTDKAQIVSAENLVLFADEVKAYSYLRMFQGCTSLTSAPELLATTLADGCYANMFDRCSSLVSPPELPATTLTKQCYKWMFEHCTSLTTAPVLPATELADGCYFAMFYKCTNLTTAPALPATTLADDCYRGMFQHCASLVTAPVLHATTLADGCYYAMFSDCTSLTITPALPATTLADNCYNGMFWNCTNLTTAPELPATTLANSCYANMLGGTSITTAPALPATTLANSCYQYMFYNCTSLNHIKAMFTTTPSATYTKGWVQGVAGSGTFVKNSAATWNVTGVNGVPEGWTVETAS